MSVKQNCKLILNTLTVLMETSCAIQAVKENESQPGISCHKKDYWHL